MCPETPNADMDKRKKSNELRRRKEEKGMKRKEKRK